MNKLLETYIEQLTAATEDYEKSRRDETRSSGLPGPPVPGINGTASLTDADLETMLPEHLTDIMINAHVPAFDLYSLPHDHTWYELTYVHSGEFCVECGSSRFSLTSGDFLLTNPGTVHKVRLGRDDSRVINILMRRSLFGTSFLYTLLENHEIAEFILPALTTDKTKDSYQIYRSRGELSPSMTYYLTNILMEYCEPESYSAAAMSLNLSGLLLELTRTKTHTAAAATRKSFSLADVYSYMNANVTHVTLSETAGHFGYNSRYFSKLLRDACGNTFTGLLQDLKLTRAALLLQRSDLPVSEVAGQCGYQNMTYFYKIFGEKYGMTPAQYRG